MCIRDRITTLRRLLTNVKDKDKPEDIQGAVYKIKCCDCQASYIGETRRNLTTRLTEHKRATNGDVNNHIAEHHLKTKRQIDRDSATCITYSTDYYQLLTVESWFTNLDQTPLNRSQQLPAPYKRLIREFKIPRLRTTATVKHATAHNLNHVTVFSRVVLRLRWVVELFRVVATTENILLAFCPHFAVSVIQESRLFVKKFSIHLL